jgi:hypothetical protein
MDRHAVALDVPALDRFQQRALMIGAAALLAGVIGAFIDRPAGEELVLGLSPQFFRSWLIGFLFCSGLALGSLAWVMLHHLSGGQWGLVSRRVFEAATRTMPIVALFFLPVLLGIPAIFEWSHPEVIESNAVVRLKEPYLNVKFFIIRGLIYFAFWMVCTMLLNRWSEGQDRGTVATTPEDTVRFRQVSAPGLLFLVLTVTFASVDWIMSLEPEWYSTIFGLLTVVGHGLSALALTIAVLAMLAPSRPMAGILAPRHFHDLGKLMLAFVMLWAYLSFSQFLIIWSGNLPEEIPWYLKRMQGAWGALAIALVVGHFALPFLLLLSRDLKRHAGLLAKLAIFVLVMRLIDAIWLVGAAYEHHGFPIHWMDVVVPAGMLGIWLFVYARNLRSRSLLPVNDPFFKESFAHEAH